MIHYRDQYAVFAAFGEIRADAVNWRLCNQRLGSVHGLPNIRGTLVATNGILALVDCGREYLFECHLDNFVFEPLERISRPAKVKTEKPTKQTKQLDNLLNEILL